MITCRNSSIEKVLKLLIYEFDTIFFLAGIYIAHDRKDVPEEFRGIGIRIEDDIVINQDRTIEVLTSNCIKEKDQLMQLLKSD